MTKVLVHGIFDVLHIGHIRLLKYARSRGDKLVVSLLSDRYATMYKREPFHDLAMRVEQMAALRCVDEIVKVDAPGHVAVIEMIERVKPQIYVKGADTKGKFAEVEYLKQNGIRLEYFPMQFVRNAKSSTTRVSEREGIHASS